MPHQYWLQAPGLESSHPSAHSLNHSCIEESRGDQGRLRVSQAGHPTAHPRCLEVPTPSERSVGLPQWPHRTVPIDRRSTPALRRRDECVVALTTQTRQANPSASVTAESSKQPRPANSHGQSSSVPGSSDRAPLHGLRVAHHEPATLPRPHEPPRESEPMKQTLGRLAQPTYRRNEPLRSPQPPSPDARESTNLARWTSHQKHYLRRRPNPSP